MTREFALTVDRSEGQWRIEISDEQGVGVEAHGSTLNYTLLTAWSYVASKFDFEDAPALRGGHP